MAAFLAACLATFFPDPGRTQAQQHATELPVIVPQLPLKDSYRFPVEARLRPAGPNGYRGTRITINSELDVDESTQRRIATLLSRADWAPADRTAYFAIYDDPTLKCVQWLGSITAIEVRGQDLIVTVQMAPHLTSLGGDGIFLTHDAFLETYVVNSKGFRYLRGKGSGSKLRGSLSQY